MPIDLAGDLANMFASAPGAVQVVMAGVPPTWGLFDAESESSDMGGHLQVNSITQALTIATGSLPGMKKGSVLALDGVAYKVRGSDLKDDGSITIVWFEVP